ncbi:hypothetical protein RRF57_005821 [Xylaria bambusicola]|uniref:DUF676 domain-containing protein n=1 Tax=Xylaria bambusicola TaxID=326684 RepID=A0AAN7UP75_9PEZI
MPILGGGLKKNESTSSALPSTDQTSALTVPSGNGLSFPDGVKVWYECDDAVIDVCFIHGLSGNRDSTWTANGQPGPWPKLFLPDRLPKARLLTFGYDAYIIRNGATRAVGINSLADHARGLLHDLTNARASPNESSRGIIFVAHSLGGLVCKSAILLSRNNPENYLQDIFDRTLGFIFLGTPHQGAWMAHLGNIAVHTLGVFASTNTKLLEILKPQNDALIEIERAFRSMVRELREGGRRLELMCFYEELKTFADVVVTQHSATFSDYPILSIHANHSDMVKFDSAENNGFQRVFAVLRRWKEGAISRLSDREISLVDRS